MNRAVALALGLLLVATAAEAQLSVWGRVMSLDRRLSDAGVVERQDGIVGGLGAEYATRFVALAVAGEGGKLTAKTESTPDADYGRIAGVLTVTPVPWIALLGGVDASVYSSPLGSQRWVLPKVGAELRAPFANIPAMAFVGAQVIVSPSTNGPTPPTGGLALGGGVSATLGRIQLFVVYRMERLDFDADQNHEEQWEWIGGGARVSF